MSDQDTAKKRKRGRPRNASKTTSKTWAVKGVENETRQKVTAAAKQSKQTIGNYVNRVLLDAANETLGNPKESRELALTTDQMLEKLITSQENLTKQVAEISERDKRGLLKKIFS